MPMKQLKTEMEKELTIEKALHARRHALALDKELCKSCGRCKEICPRETIEIRRDQSV